MGLTAVVAFAHAIVGVLITLGLFATVSHIIRSR